MYYDEERQFLVVSGMVARQMGTHVLAPRPKRDSRAVTFDNLSGNTTLGMHLTEIAPGGEKKGHRHLDEATFYIVSGKGWTELRQSDEQVDQRVDWAAGDVIAIPANAWHKHYNALANVPARQLAFKNTSLLRKLFESRDFVYKNDFRFSDRYSDEEDYWTKREPGDEGEVRTNVIRNVVSEALEAAPTAGIGVSMRQYSMGGHRMLDHAIVEIAPGGEVRPHAHLAEEALLILHGKGRTRIWSEAGQQREVTWTAGDLISPPFNIRHQHIADDDAGVRYLLMRNNFIERALGVNTDLDMDGGLPDRFPDNLSAR